MTEFSQGTNQSMNKLRALAGSFVEVHATSRGGNFNLSLAAYLICAAENMYFGAVNIGKGGKGGWRDCAGWSEPLILEKYEKPLGPPTGPGVWQDATCSWTRAFATGTRVEVRPGGRPKGGGGPKQHGESCVWWSDGSTLGTLCDKR